MKQRGRKQQRPGAAKGQRKRPAVAAPFGGQPTGGEHEQGCSDGRNQADKNFPGQKKSRRGGGEEGAKDEPAGRVKNRQGAGGQAGPGAEDGIGQGFLSPRRIDRGIHLGESAGNNEWLFGEGTEVMDGGDADAFLFRGEDDGADFHFHRGGIGGVPVDRNRAAEVDGDFLEFAAQLVPQDEGSSGKFRLGEIGAEGAGVHFEEPGGNRTAGLAEDKGQAMDMAIGLRRDFPGGGAGRAAEAFCGREKTFRRTDSPKRAVMGERGKFQFFPAALPPEGHGGEDGGVKGGQGAGELIVLKRLKGVGGIERKEKADRGGAVRGDGAEEEGEVEPRPGPRFSGQILDGNENRQRGSHGRGRHGWEKQPGSGHEKGGQEQAQGSGDDDRSDPGCVHAIGCSGE